MNHGPPAVDTVHQGTIVRIQEYGAFVQLDHMRTTGLLHISQLANQRIESVSDVVAVDDRVWVRVNEIKEESGRQKVSLTMKNVPQDGTAPQVMNEMQQHADAKQAIQSNLNSTVGLAVALDPMDGLRLKNTVGKAPKVINGYELVVDEEPVPPEPTRDPQREAPRGIRPEEASMVRPMGRGRGATLPAWMTKQQDKKGDDESKHKKSKKSKRKRRYDDESDSSSYSRRRKKQKKKKEKRKKHRRRRDYSSDSYDESDESSYERRRRRKKERRRRRDYSSASSNDDRSHRRRSEEEER